MNRSKKITTREGTPAQPISNGRISYLFIMVFDFQKMLIFYRDVLGFQVKYIQEGYCAFLDLQNGTGPQIALYEGRRSLDSDNHWFIVIDVSDIKQTVMELRSLGVQVSEIEEVPNGKAAKLADPEGNVIEIHESEEG